MTEQTDFLVYLIFLFPVPLSTYVIYSAFLIKLFFHFHLCMKHYIVLGNQRIIIISLLAFSLKLKS